MTNTTDVSVRKNFYELYIEAKSEREKEEEAAKEKFRLYRILIEKKIDYATIKVSDFFFSSLSHLIFYRNE